jgi:ABC-type sugar transport system, periplasmic component
MTRKRILIFTLVFLILAGSYLIYNRDHIIGKRNNNPYQISVITRGKSTESWTTIKLGIDQAAKDLNVEVSFVALSSENNAREQISLMQREISNGANAIVIAPANTADLKAPIEKARSSVPVVTMQSTVDTIKNLPYISSDSFQLGKALAAKLVSNKKDDGVIAILRNSMGCSNIRQRYLGVISALGSDSSKVEYWDIPDDPQEAYDKVKSMLSSSSATTLVALDGATLEAAGKAERDFMKGSDRRVQIYGLGRTNTVVSLLESQVINSIGVENEYNLGYLSIQSAVNRINRKSDDSNNRINFAIVDHQNMYNSDNQRLLFPFVG